MTLNEFTYGLTDQYWTAQFNYNGKCCGVEPKTLNAITTYCMWYGDTCKAFASVDKLLSASFFDGRSLKDILPMVEISF